MKIKLLQVETDIWDIVVDGTRLAEPWIVNKSYGTVDGQWRVRWFGSGGDLLETQEDAVNAAIQFLVERKLS